MLQCLENGCGGVAAPPEFKRALFLTVGGGSSVLCFVFLRRWWCDGDDGAVIWCYVIWFLLLGLFPISYGCYLVFCYWLMLPGLFPIALVVLAFFAPVRWWFG
jgi:hypothetical protein